MLKGDGLNPIVEQTTLRTALIREAALVRAGVMSDTWGSDRIPEQVVRVHTRRGWKADLPAVAADSFFSQFTRLYAAY